MADDKKQPIIIKKKKGGHGGHHGGAWKIAYADLVTAMMAFFLVMWIIGMDVETKQGIAEYFNNMSARAEHEPASAQIVKMRGVPPARPHQVPPKPKDNNLDRQNAEGIAGQIDGLIKANPQLEKYKEAVQVDIDDDRMRVELTEAGGLSLFLPDSTQLKPEAKRLIEGISAIMKRNRAKVIIEGHSESRGAGGGTGQTLWEQSTMRALAVRGALAAGIGDDRILEVRGLGDTRLKMRDDPANPINRRVAIVAPYDEPQ